MDSYKPLRKTSSDLGDVNDLCQSYPERNGQRSRIRALIVVLVATNILSISWNYWNAGAYHGPSDAARTDSLNIIWKRFWWNTAYSTSNRSQNDAFWDAILPSHGVIAVNRDWALDHHWPVSAYLPDDESKAFYLLEAYHHLHCLRIIRKTFWEAVDNRPFTYHPGEHMEHCFDALRQAVQCSADNTPLYSFGDNTAGDGQLHQCRDWDQLRDFATSHTACYRDSIEEIALGDHFGFCDDGDDGVRRIDEGVELM